MLNDRVMIQNKVGNYLKRWDKAGMVVEVKGYDQYMVNVDGTGHLTRRNRKYLRRVEMEPQRSADTWLSRDVQGGQPDALGPVRVQDLRVAQGGKPDDLQPLASQCVPARGAHGGRPCACCLSRC